MTEDTITLNDALKEQTREASREMKVSQSHVVALALEEFFRRRQTQRLVEQVNQAYKDGPDEEERELLRRMLPFYREVLEKEDEW
ncbi:MAG: hypothetical protein HYR56_34265 [Acidobacteria bacterium]|nr:hypothetical protein [Acidobacteriota bacterium]MBI3424849.1 hypothetical protein [Acidobacteriota bacterium]